MSQSISFLDPHHKFEKIPGATTPNEKENTFIFSQNIFTKEKVVFANLVVLLDRYPCH